MQSHCRASGSLWDNPSPLNHCRWSLPASHFAQGSPSPFSGPICHPENGLVDHSGLVLMASDWPGIPSVQCLSPYIFGIERSQGWAIQPIHHVAQLCHQQHLFNFWSSSRRLYVSLSLVLGSTGNHDYRCLDHHGLLLLLHPSADREPEPWVHMRHLFLP